MDEAQETQVCIRITRNVPELNTEMLNAVPDEKLSCSWMLEVQVSHHKPAVSLTAIRTRFNALAREDRRRRVQ